MSSSYDVAVVGAGVVGLAHAYHFARRGLRVVVFERGQRATGASVRNFGMIWPIGQPAGRMHQLALRSRSLWLEVLQSAGLWHDAAGSLHLAYHEDEAAVLAEFARDADGYECELLDAGGVPKRAPAVNPAGLQCGLWGPSEVCVDPRQVIAELPGWLAREFDVRFEFGTAVTAYERPRVVAGRATVAAERLVVCSGDDLNTLYPATLAESGLVRCKLQMMRTPAYGSSFRLGPMLAGGLTLRHYQNFAGCRSLEAVKGRVARDTPEFDRYGIHVLVSQNAHGELIIGDSHEYDDAVEPFDKAEIDELILNYLRTFLDVPELPIAARWHGIYAKHPREPFVVAKPEPGVTIVTGLGGAGMTLSFGLAEEVEERLEGET